MCPSGSSKYTDRFAPWSIVDYRYAPGGERVVEGAEILLPLHLPRDVEQPDLPWHLGGRVRTHLPEAQVVRVGVTGHGEEDHPARHPAGHGQAEDARVERFGAVEVAHLEDHVAELLQRHRRPPLARS